MNQLLFEQFVVADIASVLCKNLFLELKRDILKREGIACGYETQVIREFCNACKGTGERIIKKIGKRELKNRCVYCKGTGYRRNETRYHLRIAVNGMVFLQRVTTKPKGEPVQIVQGQRPAYPVDPQIAYRAMLILFAYYNESLLDRLLMYAIPAQDIWAKEKTQILKMIEEQKAA